jgi:outer membrane receptor protein involved in Fe transport
MASFGVLAAAFSSMPAIAQTQIEVADAAPQASLDQIVVTGSRIARDGFTQPTPVTVVGADQLKNAAPGLITEALGQLPAFKASIGATNNQNLGVVSFVNLRGLGANRTLVLLDGRRLTPSTTGNAPDINTFPQALISRVDVVTGGASAAYGSDAVAGVVNFVFDAGFTGLKGEASYGTSEYGDFRTWRGSITGGKSFSGGRGHVVGSFEYYDNDGVKSAGARDWVNRAPAVIANPGVTVANASASNPNLLLVTNARLSNTAVGGLITSGPLANTQFGPGGVPIPFNYGTSRSATTMVGGDGPWNGFYTQIAAPLQRHSLFLHGVYDLTERVQVFAEGSYFHSTSNGINTAPSQTFTIFTDNAFLPAATRAAAAAAGVTSFTLARDDLDWGVSLVEDHVKGFNLVTGAKGELEIAGRPYRWDGYLQYGRTIFSRESPNSPINVNVYNGVDSALVTPQNVGASGLTVGSVACRTSLTLPTNGCVPLNVFGPNAASQQALDYATETLAFFQHTTQKAAAFNFQGSPFATWAGDVSLAVGAEYRDVHTKVKTDRFSQTLVAPYLAANAPGLRGFPASLNTGNPGVHQFGNYQPLDGKYDVKEAYAEAVVPLATDAPFAKNLEINGAARYTDYSTSGSVGTWKLGATWQPVNDLRFRGTRSRDIRAPNIAELFSAARTLTVSVIDRAAGSTYNVQTYNAGNLALKPEKANTTTAGVVYSPTWLPGLNVSADVYKIAVRDAISSPAAQDIIDDCSAGNAASCALIVRASPQLIQSIRLVNYNLASLVEKGLDLEASYRTRLADGQLAVRALATYVKELSYKNTPTSVAVDRAGEVAPISTNGATNVGVPKWTATFSATYDRGPVSVYVQERYVEGGAISNSYNTGKYNSPGAPITYIDNNRVSPRFYTDVTLRYRFGAEDATELFGTVNNLFNVDPPIAPYQNALPLSSNGAYYDTIGRQYTVGLRAKF